MTRRAVRRLGVPRLGEVDSSDLMLLTIGLPRRLEHGPNGAAWRARLAGLWRRFGAVLIEAHGDDFTWANETFGPPRVSRRG